MASQGKQKYAYPWAELYDMESRVTAAKAKARRRGRPSSLYTRRRTSLMLSDDEASMLDRATVRLADALRPGNVTKSQVYGLAIRLLDNRLAFLSDRVSSWEDVMQSLLKDVGGR
jgi:hypothetical protein